MTTQVTSIIQNSPPYWQGHELIQPPRLNKAQFNKTNYLQTKFKDNF